MYKFEIYRSTQGLPKEYGFSERSRYNVGDYIFERTLTPVWDDLSISGKKDNGRKFFRESLDGDFSLVDEDYDWAYDMISDENNANRYRFIKIVEVVNGIRTEVWRGFFNIADGEFNISRCSVKYSGLLVFDDYSNIIENIEREKNLIDVPPTNAVTYGLNEYPYDELVTVEEVALTNSNFCNSGYIDYPTSITTGINYTLYEKKYKIIRAFVIESGGGCSYTGSVSVTRTYRRDYQWAALDPGADWDEDTDTSPDINGNKKWVRCYRGECSPGFLLTKVAKSPQTNLPIQDMTCNVCTVYDAVYSSNADADSTFENERGRLFWSADANKNIVDYIIEDVVDYSVTAYPDFTKAISLFFNQTTNPITGGDNKARRLYVWQLSDMKPTSDPATIGMYSLKDIEKMLLIFNCYWYIDEYGRFRMEHEKYFDQGLSYSGNSIGLDISNENIGTVITYLGDLPQEEKHSFAYSVNLDFAGSPIRYSGNIVNREEDLSVVEYNFEPIATDLTQVVSNPDDIGNDGFFMASVEYDGDYFVDNPSGILSDVGIYNGYLSVSYLQDYYWKWGRSLSHGFMNYVDTQFTQKRVIIQEDIVVSNCDSFDPYKLVKTSYGEGNVIEYNKTLKDKKLTLSLSYSV